MKIDKARNEQLALEALEAHRKAARVWEASILRGVRAVQKGVAGVDWEDEADVDTIKSLSLEAVSKAASAEIQALQNAGAFDPPTLKHEAREWNDKVSKTWKYGLQEPDKKPKKFPEVGEDMGFNDTYDAKQKNGGEDQDDLDERREDERLRAEKHGVEDDSIHSHLDEKRNRELRHPQPGEERSEDSSAYLMKAGWTAAGVDGDHIAHFLKGDDEILIGPDGMSFAHKSAWSGQITTGEDLTDLQQHLDSIEE
jgi:hypothetical protein